MPKEESKAERAREMPLTDKQAEKAIQALRDDAGSAAYRKRLQEKKPKGEEPVKKKPLRKMATKDAIPEIKRRLAKAKKSAEETRKAQKKKEAAGGYKNTPLGKVPTGVFLDRVKAGMKKKPGLSKGGKIRGYGMARGGKACKMM